MSIIEFMMFVFNIQLLQAQGVNLTCARMQ